MGAKMRAYCRNALTIDYTCKNALEDLQEAIRKAEEQRNQEAPRRGRGAFSIPRKW